MSRSFHHLRRVLLAAAFVAPLGFGASQAFGSAEATVARTCPARGYEYAYASCGFGCPGGRGYCSATGICQCGDIP